MCEVCKNVTTIDAWTEKFKSYNDANGFLVKVYKKQCKDCNNITLIHEQESISEVYEW